MTTIPHSLRERKKLQNRARIFDSAVELFAERSYAEVTIDDICARAEVARTTFFRFYGTKAGLLVEFNERIADGAKDRLAADPDLGAADRLRLISSLIVDVWNEASSGMRELFGEFLRSVSAMEVADEAQPALSALLTEIVAEGQDRGEFSTELTAEFIALLVIVALGACVANWSDKPEPDLLRRTSEITLGMVLDGIQVAKKEPR